MGRGLYIHIPFCFKKCNYCNFVSYPISESDINIREYLNFLLEEMKLYQNEEIDTIYIGGGTPSLLSSKDFKFIIDGINKNFVINDLKEFTVEINPYDFKIDYIKKLKELGIDRFSFGFQSFNNDKLMKLGRLHRLKDLEFIKKNRNLFENFSIDLIFGLKKDLKLMEKELNKLLEYEPEHISIYNLKVEKKTKLFKMLENNKIKLDNEDKQSKTYSYINKTLKKNGYNHYEISNYAKKNRKSIHNLKYWKFNEYIGLGISSSGYCKNKLYTNYNSFKKYKNNKFKKSEKIISKDEKRYYKIMMGLRLKEGVELTKKESKILKKFITDYNLSKYFNIEGRDISIKEKYFFISNSLIGKLLDKLF